MRIHLLAAAAVLALAPGARAQPSETETPSSAPAPSPGNPAPPLAAPPQAPDASRAAPDRSAARAAVRAQCGAERERFCRAVSAAGEDACLSARFSELSSDCQSAVTALKQARDERSGMAPR